MSEQEFPMEALLQHYGWASLKSIYPIDGEESQVEDPQADVENLSASAFDFWTQDESIN